MSTATIWRACWRWRCRWAWRCWRPRSATVGPPCQRQSGRRGRTFRQWLARFSVARLNQAALFGAAAIAILLGLIFTRSRTGVSLAMLGILLSTLTFSWRLGGRNVYGLMVRSRRWASAWPA